MTDKDGVSLWMKYIDEHYKSLSHDIEWSKCDYQAKMMAQIQEHADNTRGATNKKADKIGNITISFHLTTCRILIQGNQFGEWCREVFPCIKAHVETARQTGGSGDSHQTADDLLAELNASNGSLTMSKMSPVTTLPLIQAPDQTFNYSNRPPKLDGEASQVLHLVIRTTEFLKH